MMTDSLPHVHYHGNFHRPPRTMCFLLGCLVGIVVTAGADGLYALMNRPSDSPEAWNCRALTCTARSEAGYFVRNDSGKDYRLADAHQFTLMQSTAAGLVASDAQIHMPVFIPQGEVAQILVDPMPAGAIVLFDLGRRCKVTLK